MIVTSQLADNFGSICYVSLNKPYNTLMKNIEDNKIDKTRFLFIDAITKPLKSAEINNCIFVSSISALSELSIVITKTLERGKFGSLLFDSLSTMLIYHDIGTVTKFVHGLIVKAREINSTAIFTCLEGDAKSALIKDLGMLVDRIVSMEV